MRYNKFGKTGIDISVLGLGCRLPMITDENGKLIDVDYDKATSIIHKAFELGVNYVDCGPGYCEGKNEAAIGRALKSWKGNKIYIASKAPINSDSYDEWMKSLENSLEQLGVGCIDFFQMWGIGKESFNTKVNIKGGPIDAALKAKEQGMIKHIGFSFHDEPQNMREIVDSGYFESVLLQYNILDRSNEENIAYCQEKGLGVAVMGPVGGGKLGAPSKKIQEMLGGKTKSSTEAALRFVLSNSGVNVVVSGMETTEYVIENCTTASIDGGLTPSEQLKVEENLKEVQRMSELYCTGCRYCMPCQKNVDIPHIFSAMNYHKIYGLTDHAKTMYSWRLSPDSELKSANACVECGECESKCPQNINIIKQLKETHNELTRDC